MSNALVSDLLSGSRYGLLTDNGGILDTKLLSIAATGGIVGVTPQDWRTFISTTVPGIAAKGQITLMLPGPAGEHWIYDAAQPAVGAPLYFPSGATLLGTAATQIDCVLPSVVSVFDCPFSAGPIPSGASGGLVSPAVIGRRIIVSAVDVGNVGDSFEASSPNTFTAQTFTIVQKTIGDGQITYVVDRAVLIPLGVGDGTLLTGFTSHPHDISILGFGMRINANGPGTNEQADSGFHFVNSERVYVQDLVISAAATTNLGAGGQFDTGSYNCEMRRIHVVGSGIGLMLTGTEDCRIYTSRVRDVQTRCYELSDSVRPILEDSDGQAAPQGVLMQGSPGNINGTWLAHIKNCTLEDNISGSGIDITGGSHDNVLEGNKTFGCTTGLVVQPDGVGAPNNNLIISHVAEFNEGDGIRIVGGSLHTTLIGPICNNNSLTPGLGIDFNLAADCIITNLKSVFTRSDSQYIQINVSLGAKVKINGFDVSTAAANAQPFFATGAGSEIDASNGRLQLLTANSIGWSTNQAAVITLDNVRLVTIVAVLGTNINTAGTLRLGPNVDLTAAGANAINVPIGAFVSRSFAPGSVSAGPVDIVVTASVITVPWPNIRLTDYVWIARVDGAAGSVVPPGNVVVTPGTGFTFTPNTGEADTLRWFIR